MRLTKRQLKKIIREEYSRLKRRGLIKESDMELTQVAITFELVDGGLWTCDIPEHYLGELKELIDTEAGEYGPLDDYHKNEHEMAVFDFMQELREFCEEQASNEVGDDIGGVASCSHPGLQKLIDKAAQSDLHYDMGGY